MEFDLFEVVRSIFLISQYAKELSGDGRPW